MHDITKPASFAYWTARLGPLCPEAITLGLAALLASCEPSPGNQGPEHGRVSSLDKAHSGCCFAAITGFAQAARAKQKLTQPAELQTKQYPAVQEHHKQGSSDHMKNSGKPEGIAAWHKQSPRWGRRSQPSCQSDQLSTAISFVCLMLNAAATGCCQAALATRLSSGLHFISEVAVLDLQGVLQV